MCHILITPLHICQGDRAQCIVLENQGQVLVLSLVPMRVKGNKICKFVIVRFVKQVRGGAHCTSGSNAALIRINKGNR